MKHYINTALILSALAVTGCNAHPTILKSKSAHNATAIEVTDPVVICPVCGKPEEPIPHSKHSDNGNHYGQTKPHNHKAPHCNG